MNLSVPSDGGRALIIVCVVLSVVQIVFVAARFYTRYMQRMKCGIDDYVMLLALVRIVPHDVPPGNISANALPLHRLEAWQEQSFLSSVSTS